MGFCTPTRADFEFRPSRSYRFQILFGCCHFHCVWCSISFRSGDWKAIAVASKTKGASGWTSLFALALCFLDLELYPVDTGPFIVLWIVFLISMQARMTGDNTWKRGDLILEGSISCSWVPFWKSKSGQTNQLETMASRVVMKFVYLPEQHLYFYLLGLQGRNA